jgi:hypothetical protein
MDSLTYLNQWLPAAPLNNFAGASAPNHTDGSPLIGSIPLSGLSSRGWAEPSD